MDALQDPRLRDRKPSQMAPGWANTEYQARRTQIAELAAGDSADPTDIEYLRSEDACLEELSTELHPLWDQFVADDLLIARERLSLPTDEVPQLAWVTGQMSTGFTYRAMPGLVDRQAFFGALADNVFLSTQYLRDSSDPRYTPEPDIAHEVIGHATMLTDPRLAGLHRSAGAAIRRLKAPESRQFVSDVFWFSGEFGVIHSADCPAAYGAGLLSSFGELSWFRGEAEIRPLDVAAMGTLPYDITEYQPALFAGDSIDHVIEVVGGFFEFATDESIALLRAA